MKTCILVVLFAVLAPAISAEARGVRVRGYVRASGSLVLPHARTAPDGRFMNNWTTRGNTNPYTGRAGTRVMPRAR